METVVCCICGVCHGTDNRFFYPFPDPIHCIDWNRQWVAITGHVQNTVIANKANNNSDCGNGGVIINRKLVCSMHFEVEDFQGIRLKPNALPSKNLFDNPSNNQQRNTSLLSDDDAMPPPADLDKLDDIKPESKDTSRNYDSSFDSCLSPPPLTAIYSGSFEDLSNNFNSTASSSFTNSASEVTTNDSSANESVNSSCNDCKVEPESSSPGYAGFEKDAIDGLVILSFMSQKDVNKFVSDSTVRKRCREDQALCKDDGQLDTEFGGSNPTLEIQVARKRRRECSSNTRAQLVVTPLTPPPQGLKVRNDLMMSSNRCVSQHPPASIQCDSKILHMPTVKIILSDCIKDFERRTKSTEIDLTGRFRLNDAGEIESSEARRKHHKDRNTYTLKLENTILKKKLKDHEKTIDGLTRQHTQMLKLINTKDKELETLKQQLGVSTCLPSLVEGATKQYLDLVNRIKTSKIPNVSSLLSAENGKAEPENISNTTDQDIKPILTNNNCKPKFRSCSNIIEGSFPFKEKELDNVAKELQQSSLFVRQLMRMLYTNDFLATSSCTMMENQHLNAITEATMKRFSVCRRRNGAIEKLTPEYIKDVMKSEFYNKAARCKDRSQDVKKQICEKVKTNKKKSKSSDGGARINPLK